MVIKDWRKTWTGKATTHYQNQKKPWIRIYIYNKGWFRGQEKNYVVSTFYKSGRTNRPFKFKKDALKYAKTYMKMN